MRKSIFLLPAILINLIFLNSCKKEIPANAPNNEIISKVNVWLDIRKPANKITQSENVELLRNNLDFPALRIEQSAGNEKIIVIPVKDGLKQKKNIDAKAIPNLVVILDNMGNIRRVNIVLFNPKAGNDYNRVPANTFHDIINTGTSKTNGKFKYLSITGKKIYELEYEDARLKSFGHFKDSSSSNHGARTTGCTHWYWVYTLLDELGNVWATWEEYYGTTCEGEDCEDPYNAMLCPGGGGGVGGDEASEYDLEAESALMSQVFTASTHPAFKFVSFSSQEPVEEDVNFSWVIVKNSLNLWQVTSADIARGYNSSNPNIGALLYDIAHQSSAISGTTNFSRIPRSGAPPLPLINLSWQESSSSKTIAANYKSGTVTVSGALKNWGITVSSYTQSCTVNV